MKRSFVLIVLTMCFLTITACTKNNKDFVFKYQNKDYLLGEVFTKEKYGEPLKYSEVASCAFDGIDKTYTYNHYEVTTYPVDGQDKVYVIYFLDDEVTTTEGLKISDSIEDMFNKYGKDYQKEGNLYTYKQNKTMIKFIVENDYVTSIEDNYEI